MKKGRIIKTFTDYFFRNRLLFVLTVFCIMSGTVIGSLSAASISGERFDALSGYMNNFLSAYGIQSANRSEIFLFSLYANIKILLFMWVSGLWIGFIPIGLLQLGIKGYKLGFTVAFLIQLYGGKGIMLILVSLLSQVLFLIPALMFFAVFNLKFAVELRRIRLRGNLPDKDVYFKNFLALLFVLIILVLCSLIDAFIVPTVLKPVSLFLKG